MGFRKYELGSYEDMVRDHTWEVPERYNIAQDVCDKHDRDRLAMVWENYNGDERRVTFGELQDLSNKFANVLEAEGVEREDRVATLLPSLPETAAVFIGTYKRGAILLSMSVLYGDEGIEHRLRDSGAKVLVTDAENVGRIPEGIVETVLVMGDGFEEKMDAASADYEMADTSAEDPAQLYYSSGTTGKAKGILHAHRYLLGARGVRVLPRRPRRRALPRHGRVGLGGRHLPAAGAVALRLRGAGLRAQGWLRPRRAAALPVEARGAEHVHHADRAAGDDRG